MSLFSNSKIARLTDYLRPAKETHVTQEIFTQRPQPFLHFEHPIVICWSAKCACTHVFMWHLKTLGLLDAAFAHHPWPHKFRRHYYLRRESKRASETLMTQGTASYTLLHVTRDPVARFTSIFRHVLRHGVLQDLVSDALGKNIRETGLSASELLQVIAHQHENATPDIHFAMQSHPITQKRFGRRVILNIDTHDMLDGLNQFAKTTDLPVVDFTAIPEFAKIAQSHHGKNADLTVSEDLFHTPFKVGTFKEFPKGALLQSRKLKEAVTEVFAKDIGTNSTTDSQNLIAFKSRA
jgi:hypothetical protein